MSRFTFRRRDCDVGKINPRSENHGQDKVPATDVPVVIKGTKRDIANLVRNISSESNDKFADLIYENGQLVFPDLSPMFLNRAPENLDVTFYENTKKTAYLTFTDAKAKDIKITFGPKCALEIEFKLQVLVDPDRDAAKLYKLMDHPCQIEIIARQNDLLDGDEDDEEEEDEGGEQTDLVDDKDEESEED